MVDRDRFRNIDPEDLYRRLAMGEPILVLDVRTSSEFSHRHIPGSLLMPLHQIQERWPDIPNSGTPVAIVSQHGMRARSACRFLSERGVAPLYRMDGGLERWPGPTGRGEHLPKVRRFGIGPSRFLVESFDLLPRHGLALDVATGEGRNAIFLASRGLDVDCVDVDPDAVQRARVSARRLGVPIRAVVGNLEDGTYIIPLDGYDLIVVFNYLHRPLFPDIRDGVRPGGVVLYETFHEDQPRFGRPTNPDYLLRSGELKREFADWEILRYFEGVDSERPGGPERAVARIVARRPVEPE